jgi:hypothetical protein
MSELKLNPDNNSQFQSRYVAENDSMLLKPVEEESYTPLVNGSSNNSNFKQF